MARELRDADSDLDKVRGGGEAYIAEFTASRDAAAAAAASTPVVSHGGGVVARGGLSEGITALHAQQHKQVANEIRHLEAAVRSTEACIETTASAVKAYIALKGSYHHKFLRREKFIFCIILHLVRNKVNFKSHVTCTPCALISKNPMDPFRCWACRGGQVARRQKGRVGGDGRRSSGRRAGCQGSLPWTWQCGGRA